MDVSDLQLYINKKTLYDIRSKGGENELRALYIELFTKELEKNDPSKIKFKHHKCRTPLKCDAWNKTIKVVAAFLKRNKMTHTINTLKTELGFFPHSTGFKSGKDLDKYFMLLSDLSINKEKSENSQSDLLQENKSKKSTKSNVSIEVHVSQDVAHVFQDVIHDSQDIAHVSQDVIYDSQDVSHVFQDVAHVSQDVTHVSQDVAHVFQDVAHDSDSIHEVKQLKAPKLTLIHTFDSGDVSSFNDDTLPFFSSNDSNKGIRESEEVLVNTVETIPSLEIKEDKEPTFDAIISFIEDGSPTVSIDICDIATVFRSPPKAKNYERPSLNYPTKKYADGSKITGKKNLYRFLD